eukprot:1155033-Pelagomonas_calceolata.AAC.6
MKRTTHWRTELPCIGNVLAHEHSRQDVVLVIAAVAAQALDQGLPEMARVSKEKRKAAQAAPTASTPAPTARSAMRAPTAPTARSAMRASSAPTANTPATFSSAEVS